MKPPSRCCLRCPSPHTPPTNLHPQLNNTLRKQRRQQHQHILGDIPIQHDIKGAQRDAPLRQQRQQARDLHVAQRGGGAQGEGAQLGAGGERGPAAGGEGGGGGGVQRERGQARDVHAAQRARDGGQRPRRQRRRRAVPLARRVAQDHVQQVVRQREQAQRRGARGWRRGRRRGRAHSLFWRWGGGAGRGLGGRPGAGMMGEKGRGWVHVGFGFSWTRPSVPVQCSEWMCEGKDKRRREKEKWDEISWIWCLCANSGLYHCTMSRGEHSKMGFFVSFACFAFGARKWSAI